MQATAGTVEAYGEYLARSYPWEYFHTLTLDNGHSHNGERVLLGHCHRYFYRLYHEMACRLGRDWRVVRDGRTIGYRGPLSKEYKRQKMVRPVYVFAIEPHKSGQSHVHALSLFPRFFYREQRPDVPLPWEQTWIDFHDAVTAWAWGRIKIERPKCREDVTSYVAKYLSKLGELQFSDTYESGRRRSGQLTHRARSSWSTSPGLPRMASGGRKASA